MEGESGGGIAGEFSNRFLELVLNIMPENGNRRTHTLVGVLAPVHPLEALPGVSETVSTDNMTIGVLSATERIIQLSIEGNTPDDRIAWDKCVGLCGS